MSYRFLHQPYKVKPLDLSRLSVPKAGSLLEVAGAEFVRCATNGGISGQILSIARELGFDSYTYGCLCLRAGPDPQLYVSTSLSSGWMMRYHDAGYVEIDPRIGHCLGNVAPLAWTITDFRSPELTQFAEDMKAAGLSSGITIPVHGPGGEPGMLSFQSANAGFWATVSPTTRSLIVAKACAVATYLHQHIIGSHLLTARPDASCVRRAQITPRERELLVLASKGMESHEMAERLGLSARTVHFHFANILEKLNANNRIQAVAIAVELKLITSMGINPTPIK